ncbi:hypothetical protein [Chiayiivirga flava]|uniref:Peptidase C39 domain-containing protein n=1 Tax=Chiayiivirga flava TaxID=659595 RepID=A0A7W8FZP6_9GAMM|nr:hypothetical protein [Chiayiivirga flava]MBB5206858.1 hypothetical protein [Chiayiivirga flava]
MSKVPFRQQASEYDCVPTTFINGLSALFQRKEIPAAVIQKVFLYTLDSFERGTHGQGTTLHATALLADWLERCRLKNFGVKAVHLEGASVNFGPGSLVSKCLNAGGVALLGVTWGKNGHYILALRHDARWVYAFDPYPIAHKNKKHVESLEFDGKQGPNCRILKQWLNVRSDKSNYRLGTIANRDCVLLSRSSDS